MANVHIVVRKGVEWTNIIDVFSEKKDAVALAGKKNDKATTSKDVYERLSYYDVVSKKIK